MSINVLYGMTKWSASIIRNNLIHVDYVCDQKAIVFTGEPLLFLSDVPVINIMQLKECCVDEDICIYVCVGTNRNTVKSVLSDISNSGINAKIYNIFEDSYYLKHICRDCIISNSEWVGEGIINDDYVVLTNNEEYAEYQGLFSNIQAIICYLHEARKAGFKPLVDFRLGNEPLKEFWSFQNKDNKSKNSWEYYFTQPDKTENLSEIYKKYKVRYINKNYGSMYRMDWYNVLPSDNETFKLWSTVIKENIHFRDEIFNRGEYYKTKLFKDDRVLGVAIRSEFRFGGEQGIDLYNGHPRIAKVEEYIVEVERLMKKWGYPKVFLMVDDREYHDRIKDYFGDKFLSIERPLAHFFENGEPIVKGLPWAPDNSKQIFTEFEGISQIEKTESYLIETYLLSQCDSLFCTLGSAHSFAYFLNEKQYKNVSIDNRGYYDLKY